jgi:hypothetical protein
MTRRAQPTVLFALLGVLAALLFPADGSAFRGIGIGLTATGPSPAVLTMPAGLYPLWFNRDSAAHTVDFSNGCSIQVEPGATGQCESDAWSVVGDYSYTVDGKTQASIVVTAEGRTVTLAATSHSIPRRSGLTLRGRLAVAQLSPPTSWGPRQPVIVLARPDRYHPFHRIATVTADPRRAADSTPYSVWRLRVHPRAKTIYIAEANSQPAGGQFWQRAWSKPFRVRVRR